MYFPRLCVCVCVCMHNVWVHVYVCTHMYMHVCMYMQCVCACACGVCTHMHMCMWMHMYVCVHTHVHAHGVRMCMLCVCVCVCVCSYGMCVHYFCWHLWLLICNIRTRFLWSVFALHLHLEQHCFGFPFLLKLGMSRQYWHLLQSSCTQAAHVIHFLFLPIVCLFKKQSY